MPVTAQIDYQQLAIPLKTDDTCAVGLFGSHARGDFGRYSDIDVVRFIEAGAEPRTHLVDGNFVVVSDVSSAVAETWFTSPVAATQTIRGLASAIPLIDPDQYLAKLIHRAQKFDWDDEMQFRADLAVSEMMVGWIEEVQKALEGLRRDDIGRMLNGKHGLTWGMLTVMRVKRGVLLSGDNGAFTEVIEALGTDSPWSDLCAEAFGVAGSCSLSDELIAGLKLYRLTTEMIAADLVFEHRSLVEEVVSRITSEGI